LIWEFVLARKLAMELVKQVCDDETQTTKDPAIVDDIYVRVTTGTSLDLSSTTKRTVQSLAMVK
jgi:hypothetical protein